MTSSRVGYSMGLPSKFSVYAAVFLSMGLLACKVRPSVVDDSSEITSDAPETFEPPHFRDCTVDFRNVNPVQALIHNPPNRDLLLQLHKIAMQGSTPLLDQDDGKVKKQTFAASLSMACPRRMSFFHITKNVGSSGWNTRDSAVRVHVGETLRIVNDGSSYFKLRGDKFPCFRSGKDPIQIDPHKSWDCLVNRKQDTAKDGALQVWPFVPKPCEKPVDGIDAKTVCEPENNDPPEKTGEFWVEASVNTQFPMGVEPRRDLPLPKDAANGVPTEVSVASTGQVIVGFAQNENGEGGYQHVVSAASDQRAAILEVAGFAFVQRQALHVQKNFSIKKKLHVFSMKPLGNRAQICEGGRELNRDSAAKVPHQDLLREMLETSDRWLNSFCVTFAHKDKPSDPPTVSAIRDAGREAKGQVGEIEITDSGTLIVHLKFPVEKNGKLVLYRFFDENPAISLDVLKEAIAARENNRAVRYQVDVYGQIKDLSAEIRAEQAAAAKLEKEMEKAKADAQKKQEAEEARKSESKTIY